MASGPPQPTAPIAHLSSGMRIPERIDSVYTAGGTCEGSCEEPASKSARTGIAQCMHRVGSVQAQATDSQVLLFHREWIVVLTGESCGRAVVVGLDGAIGRCMETAETPNIDECVSRGVATFSGLSVLPSSSYEAWGSMFHGVTPDIHQLGAGSQCSEDVEWPSVVKLLRQMYPDARMASFSSWAPIHTHILERSCELHCVSKPDADLVIDASDYIRGEFPDFVFVHLDDIDAAGHASGFGSRAYLDQIKRTDELVGHLIRATQDAGTYDDTLFILLSDHGGHGTQHGSDHPDCLNIFWVCFGPSVHRGGLLETFAIADTAAVIARGLGISRPVGWSARVPEGVFAIHETWTQARRAMP